mgnify:CR=1 FL=1|tara:strand:- start:38 stop:328 length:291 start_codon:yes stop_codon:yes gene_type:complete
MIHRQLKRGEDMNNKENLQYFEATSMKGLFNNMKDWQVKNKKRLLSTNIQQEGDIFTCIALTNPTEVVLCDEQGNTLGYTFDGIGVPVLSVRTEFG